MIRFLRGSTAMALGLLAWGACLFLLAIAAGA